LTLETIGQPFAVKIEGRLIHLRPGTPMEFTDTQGLRLLARARGRIRVVSGQTPVTAGKTITWESPLFGLLTGPVLTVIGGGITVMHPLSEKPCTIPRGWVR
jgi:hypothetical protein